MATNSAILDALENWMYSGGDNAFDPFNPIHAHTYEQNLDWNDATQSFDTLKSGTDWEGGLEKAMEALSKQQSKDKAPVIPPKVTLPAISPPSVRTEAMPMQEFHGFDRPSLLLALLQWAARQ